MSTDLYKQFDSDLASCNKCADILANFRIDPCASDESLVPRPVVSGIRTKPVMVIGQTPGLTGSKRGQVRKRGGQVLLFAFPNNEDAQQVQVMGSGLAFYPKNEEPNKRAQERARATDVDPVRQVISGARRFTPDVRLQTNKRRREAGFVFDS
ncbi:hypothetical protein THIOKS12580019 [Thiocapsa sp. KS1]|nr:hypothetical protein THIOKS12580019 [Thiocapsa sp. KS1]